MSLVSVGSLAKESEVEVLDLPSTLDRFEAAWDLITTTTQQSPVSSRRYWTQDLQHCWLRRHLEASHR